MLATTILLGENYDVHTSYFSAIGWWKKRSKQLKESFVSPSSANWRISVDEITSKPRLMCEKQEACTSKRQKKKKKGLYIMKYMSCSGLRLGLGGKGVRVSNS